MGDRLIFIWYIHTLPQCLCRKVFKLLSGVRRSGLQAFCIFEVKIHKLCKNVRFRAICGKKFDPNWNPRYIITNWSEGEKNATTELETKRNNVCNWSWISTDNEQGRNTWYIGFQIHQASCYNLYQASRKAPRKCWTCCGVKLAGIISTRFSKKNRCTFERGTAKKEIIISV
jgi:hypothetical protein